MKSVLRPHDTSSGNLHPDGAIRCPFGLHSLVTDEGDRVEIRARGLIQGDQLARLITAAPGGYLALQAVRQAFQDALSYAGVEVAQAEVVVFPPEHDCNALIEGTGPEPAIQDVDTGSRL